MDRALFRRTFKWHAMHFKCLLLTMLEDDRLTAWTCCGLTRYWPSSLAMTARCRRITCGRSTRSYVRRHHPSLLPQMMQWME